MSQKAFYRPDELATALGEPVRNIYRWIRRGKIDHVKVDRKIMIPRKEFVRIVGKHLQHT